jgi:hypothetical protein
MAQSDLPVPFTLRLNSAGAIPDPIAEPQYYEGLLSRRIVAYFLDLGLIVLLWMGAFVLGLIAKIVTFGLLSPLVVLVLAVLAPAYHGPGSAHLRRRTAELAACADPDRAVLRLGVDHGRAGVAGGAVQQPSPHLARHFLAPGRAAPSAGRHGHIDAPAIARCRGRALPS